MRYGVGDKRYMELALEQAKKASAMGEVPIGAVIAKDGLVVASAHNLCETWRDATAHAEMLAIKQASEVLNNSRLTGCTLYVTVEPCPMCAGALVMSRVSRLVYGCPDSKAGAAESLFNIVDNKALNHQVQTVAGVCEEECRQLMQEFFQEKR